MKKNCKKTEVDLLREEILSFRVSMLEIHQIIERQNDLINRLMSHCRDESEFVNKFYEYFKKYEDKPFLRKFLF